MESIKKYIAEAIGTFVLVLFGCGTACAVGCDSQFGAGYLTTALAFGLVIVAMAYSIGNISGCHINPAVSIAMWVSKKLTLQDFCGYVISQIIGGIAGAAVIGVLFDTDCGYGANMVVSTSDGGIIKSLAIEVILTFVFVLTILGVTSKKEFANVAGLVIGLTLTLVHILGIYFTGTSVNPARSIASAIMAHGDPLKYLWVFVLAPLVGGVIAAYVWQILNMDDSVEKK